ncbi:gluconeogenesis factor YvcK family protein [Calditerricola satsumensis]|uniref:Gluconeogenesis factor n=1 Tax=Calditerricola satsumensis TaxID=373054 RepID=A0A8J3B840_9BACI|nr:YvcK family protein [Calditerricola satsumensis]GGK02440.1 gluconeogenesis factor [Calditerricola satsumensis]
MIPHGGIAPRDNPRVVVIGGGTGLSVLLRGLKERPVHISAIVTVADDGGSSGVLRDELNMPPPGDVRNVLLALADTEPLLERLLQYRFTNGTGLAGHTVGNLLIAAMKEIEGDFVRAVKKLSRVLAVRGDVLPAANQAIVLKAEMEDGTVVTGESKIPLAGKRIRRVWLDPPDVAALPEAVAALEQADAIVLGPGSLYTSLLPNLLVPGIVDAIRRSPAVKLYICNVMTQPGETDGYSAADHVQALVDHVGDRLFDYVIVHSGRIPSEVAQRYAQEGKKPVRCDRRRLEAMGYRVIVDELAVYRTYLRHNAARLSDHILRIASQHRRGQDG